MYYARWMAKLAKQDTKLVKSVRRKDYWYLFEVSGMFINWEPKYYIWNLIYVGALISAQLYAIPCLVVTLFRVDELSTPLNILALGLISLCMTAAAHINRSSVLTVLSMKEQGYYHYGDTLNLEELGKLNEVFNLTAKVVLFMLPTWLILTVSSIILSDHVDGIFGYNTTRTSVYVNGVYQNLPVKVWLFHTIDSELKWFITLLIEIVAASGMAFSVSWSNILFLTLGQNLIIEMKTLAIAIRETDSRAYLDYTRRTDREPPADSNLRRKDPELMKSYRACLKQTMEHHKTILFAFQLYRAASYWPTGACVLNGAIMVSMSTISLMKGEGKPGVTLTSALLFVAEMALIFSMCELGEAFKQQGEEISNTMYLFRWWECTKEVTTDVRFMMTRMSKPMILHGTLTPLNRDTFSRIINTAYSYVNLLLAK